jgi:hypothetical protein
VRWPFKLLLGGLGCAHGPGAGRVPGRARTCHWPGHCRWQPGLLWHRDRPSRGDGHGGSLRLPVGGLTRSPPRAAARRQWQARARGRDGRCPRGRPGWGVGPPPGRARGLRVLRVVRARVRSVVNGASGRRAAAIQVRFKLTPTATGSAAATQAGSGRTAALSCTGSHCQWHSA